VELLNYPARSRTGKAARREPAGHTMKNEE
jgi:hypothetical protein